MSDSTLRLTTAQAIIKYLANQFLIIDGEKTRICGGGFGIFGHGNVSKLRILLLFRRFFLQDHCFL